MTVDTIVQIIGCIIAAITLLGGLIKWMTSTYRKLSEIRESLVALVGKLDTIAAELKGSVGVLDTRVTALEKKSEESSEDRGKLWEKVSSLLERLTAVEGRNHNSR